MKYKILKSSDVLGLQDSINNYLSSGWKLRNNLFVFKNSLMQQMVKHEVKEEPEQIVIEPNIKIGEVWYLTIGHKKFAELALIEDITKETVVLSFVTNHTMLDVKRYPRDYINFLERKTE